MRRGVEQRPLGNQALGSGGAHPVDVAEHLHLGGRFGHARLGRCLEERRLVLAGGEGIVSREGGGQRVVARVAVLTVEQV